MIAGAIAAWVPQDFWKAFFLTDHPILATLWGPLVGPLVAIIAFVCTVGNIPLAAVLWNGGISFGGVLAFILADLIVLPILNIYRKYYGLNMAAFLLVTFYVAMAAAAMAVEGLFGSLGLIPHERQARVVEASITWNYTTWLNIGFLLLTVFLVWRFVTTGGIEMLRMMNKPARGDEGKPRRTVHAFSCGTHFERSGRVIRVRRFLSFARSFLATAFLIMFIPASGLGFVGAGMEEILSSSASISCEISSTPFVVFLSRTPDPPPFSAMNSTLAASNASCMA